MAITILEKEYAGETYYEMASDALCYRFTYSGGVVKSFWESNGITTSGFNLYAGTLAECLAEMSSKGLTPITPTRLSFECIVDSGAGKSFQLPLESGGTYDFDVWTKKTTDKEFLGDPVSIDTWNQAETDLSFDEDASYNIKIEGTIKGFRFNNGGDKSKLLNIQSWGSLNLGNNNGYFYGCNNLIVTAFDKLDLTDTTTFYRAFRDCASLTSFIDGWNCMDTSSITNMYQAFRGCTNFNADISGWDVSSVTDFTNMFSLCSAFNVDISGWDTSSATTFMGMFNACVAFDQDISGWNVESVTDMALMFNGATLSTANYNPLLIAWSAQSVQSGVTFSAGSSKYDSGDPTTARAVLVGAPNNWTITDGGQV